MVKSYILNSQRREFGQPHFCAPGEQDRSCLLVLGAVLTRKYFQPHVVHLKRARRLRRTYHDAERCFTENVLAWKIWIGYCIASPRGATCSSIESATILCAWRQCSVDGAVVTTFRAKRCKFADPCLCFAACGTVQPCVRAACISDLPEVKDGWLVNRTDRSIITARKTKIPTSTKYDVSLGTYHVLHKVIFSAQLCNWSFVLALLSYVKGEER
jgi:hypothetical protein